MWETEAEQEQLFKDRTASNGQDAGKPRPRVVAAPTCFCVNGSCTAAQAQHTDSMHTGHCDPKASKSESRGNRTHAVCPTMGRVLCGQPRVACLSAWRACVAALVEQALAPPRGAGPGKVAQSPPKWQEARVSLYGSCTLRYCRTRGGGDSYVCRACFLCKERGEMKTCAHAPLCTNAGDSHQAMACPDEQTGDSARDDSDTVKCKPLLQKRSWAARVS